MILQPIPGEPALITAEREILIIADLHIGIENEFREHGVYGVSKTLEMRDRIIALLDKYKPSKLLVLGDVKHSIPSSPLQEKKELKDFFQVIEGYVEEIHILPGNHDGGINKILPRSVVIHPSSGVVIEDTGLLHGHSWPSEELMNSRLIVFAHTHPTIRLKDRLGLPIIEPCWVKGSILEEKIKERYKLYNEDLQFLIIPAFNPLCGGVAVNEEELVGPMKNIMDILESQVYLLDGSFLGRVRDL